MRQPHLVHDPPRPNVHIAVRIVEKFEHKAVANEVRRVQAKGLVQLKKPLGAVVGRFDFPPELKAEQALVETTGTLAIRDT
jgi:hypothetical protein